MGLNPVGFDWVNQMRWDSNGKDMIESGGVGWDWIVDHIG